MVPYTRYIVVTTNGNYLKLASEQNYLEFKAKIKLRSQCQIRSCNRLTTEV